MIHLTKHTLLSVAIFSLAACNSGTADSSTSSSPDQSHSSHGQMDHSQMDHSGMSHSKMSGDTGHTTGVIVSISEDGQQATINHQEIAGVGMGAMTMGFGILSSVDLSDYKSGDNVSFMVKKGRDGSYRITAICNTDTDGADCLKAKMDHSGH
ncbi:MAG: copper-binding protein [Maricaulaceae bacterium]